MQTCRRASRRRIVVAGRLGSANAGRQSVQMAGRLANAEHAAPWSKDRMARPSPTVKLPHWIPFAAAPRHVYLVRSVDPVDPPLAVPQASYIAARGPFTEAADRALLETHRIETIVAKNSGGEASYAKIAAARALGIPVIMLARPALPEVATAATVKGVLAWLDHASAPSTARGV